MADMPQENMATVEQSLRDLIDKSIAALGTDRRELLSKVLFPDTHKRYVEIEGVKYELNPMPLKLSKKVNAELKEYADLVMKNATSTVGEAYDAGAAVADQLSNVGKVLCDHYATKDEKWSKLKEAIENEDLVIDDIQDLVVTQQAVQGTNDFLLVPLRLLIGMMQLEEVTSMKDLSYSQTTSTS